MGKSGKTRLVRDTDVLVAAFRSDLGASRQLVVAALDQRITLLVSVPLMLEYEAVLKRPLHLAASGLEPSEVDSILDALSAVLEPVRFEFVWKPNLADPGDEMVLETAVNGGADCLVTFNVRLFSEGARIFGIQVISPSEAWRELASEETNK